MHLAITASTDRFRLKQPFAIARGSKTHADVVTVRLDAEGVWGWGESVPYSRYGETMEAVLADIGRLPRELDRGRLRELLPPGAARNAVDCALWDLEAKRAGRPVWELAGLYPPDPVETAITLSIDSPEAMGREASRNSDRRLIKVKLGTKDDLARLEAVHRAAPAADLIVDANEGWSPEDYARIAPQLSQFGVVLLEQPLPAGKDDALLELPRPVPVCADESFHVAGDLSRLRGKYDAVNIKLDKTGGLTEALSVLDEARAAGFEVMIGCMVGSSLAMAPAFLLTRGAVAVDLDGPLLLAEDRPNALLFDGARLQPPKPALWG